MNRRRFLTLVSASVGLATAGCLSSEGSEPAPADDDPSNQTDDGSDGTDEPSDDPGDDPGTEPSTSSIVNGSFEDDLEGWEVGTDLPQNPGEESGKVDHSVEVKSELAAEGEKALFCFIDGSADDGTVWVEQQIDFTDVEKVLVDAYSEQKSFNILSQVAFFAGKKPDGGLTEKDFNRDEEVQDHEGWKTYQYDVADRDGTGTVAVGMNVIWETGITSVFDNIRTGSGSE
jgi:hypothetical protein